MKNIIRASYALLILISLKSGYAQTASSASASTQDTSKSDVVVLNPFTVDDKGDNSWTATSTLVGTRTNQELSKVPTSVDVLTSEFLTDLGLESMDDAAGFVAGLTVLPRNESRNDDSRVSYRGLTGGTTISRNFFMWYVPADTYNVERLDFSKGSNSLMFGDAAPGGQVTVYTKRPSQRSITDLYAMVGSFGARRFTLDVNRKINDKLAVRLNIVDRLDTTYIENNYQRLRAEDMAVQYKPFKNTTLIVEGEAGKYTRRRADNAISIYQNAAPGAGFSSSNKWYYTSDGTIIQNPGTLASVDKTAAGGNQLALLQGMTETIYLPGGVAKQYQGFSKNFNALGSNDYLDRPYNVATITLDQNINKLALEFSYNQQFQAQNRTDNSFGTSQTPPVMGVDSKGRLYIDETGTTPFKIFGNRVDVGRVSMAYPFEFGKWTSQYLVVSASRQKDFASNRRFGVANDAAAGTLANNTIYFRAYLDDPTAGTTAYWNQFLLQNLKTSPTFHPVLYEYYTNTGPYVDIRYNRNLSASLSGEYWGGRLHTMAGISFSRVSRKIPAAYTYTTDATGHIIAPGNPDVNPAAYVYDGSYDLGTRSEMAGFSFDVIKRDSATLSVYGVYSSSFNWQSAQTFYGQVLGPILGVTHEAGFKGDLFDKKVFVTAAVFDIKRKNVPFVWSPDNLNATQLEDLINPNNLSPGQAGYISVVNGLNNERKTVNSNEESKGGELTIQGRRAYGLQLRLTASIQDVTAAPDFGVLQSLLNAAIARTTAANATGGTASMAENATYIASAQTIINSNTLTNSVQGRRSAPYLGSFVADYEVPHAKGLRVGVNAILTPNYNVAIYNGVVYKHGGQMPVGLYAIYNAKIRRQTVTFRGSVQNLYDVINGGNPYRITGSTGQNTGTGLPNYIYRYRDPAVYSFSAEVHF